MMYNETIKQSCDDKTPSYDKSYQLDQVDESMQCTTKRLTTDNYDNKSPLIPEEN